MGISTLTRVCVDKITNDSDNYIVEPRLRYFLILNGIVFALVLLYVRSRRKKQAKNSAIQNLGVGAGGSINTDYHKQTKGTNKDYEEIVSSLKEEEDDEPDSERSVNVVFTWNGHDWDAYEVLGVAAGSSKSEVTEAYREALNRVDKKSQKFIEKAYRSICQKVG